MSDHNVVIEKIDTHIAELIENFYNNRDKILSLIDKYVHDNIRNAELMVISRINYLYKVLKEKKLFPRKYWNGGRS